MCNVPFCIVYCSIKIIIILVEKVFTFVSMSLITMKITITNGACEHIII